MKKTFAALATAATMATGFAPAAHAMSDELMMITGQLFNILQQYDVPVERMSELTLDEINRVNLIVHGGDSDGEIRAQLMRLIEN